jgi:glutamine cyclotransferase
MQKEPEIITGKISSYINEESIKFGDPIPMNKIEIPPPVQREEIDPKRVSEWDYQVVQAYKHDKDAFTQGLEFHEHMLYEGTGLNGKSTLRVVDYQTGDVLFSLRLEPEFFGEGITILGDFIYQLTWKSKLGFMYNKSTRQRVGTWNYNTDGWGLTNDGKHLIQSDGTSTIYFYDPLNPEILIKTIHVEDNGKPITNLNELEYIDGEIYANIWHTDKIARIDPETGHVNSFIDLTGLGRDFVKSGEDVLNGIAYDKDTKKLYVTGKNWPKLFYIKLIPKKLRW